MAASGQSKKKRVGLLGGSFNPAHEGHIYISLKAIEILGLDEVWWIVSPQNPLKSPDDMADFSQRMHCAEEITAQYPLIKVSDFEKVSGTSYTIDTISSLKSAHPDCKFVFLIGADNMLQLPKWHRWREVVTSVHIAIFNRDHLKSEALAGEFAQEFMAARCFAPQDFMAAESVKWIFLDIKQKHISATNIRGGGT